jgi:hypothetical protein
MVDTADKDAALSPAEKLFKKNQLLAEGPTAALEYRERQKATLENMKRLRALRLAHADQHQEEWSALVPDVTVQGPPPLKGAACGICRKGSLQLEHIDGVDCDLPLENRKRRLQAPLSKKRKRIVYNNHLKGDGEAFFRHACKLGCEGIISKRRDLPYHSGRAEFWLNIKNPNSPAMLRVEEATSEPAT